jgi:hypothetical protein
MSNLLTQIGAILLAPILFVGSYLTAPFQVHDLQERITQLESQGEELGRAVNPVGGQSYALYGGGVGTTDTTITLASFKIPVSNVNYQMADFGDTAQTKGYLTIEPGSATRQEFISFTGITQNSNGSASLTGVSRGLAPISPYTASTTYAKAHPGGSVVVISNPPQLYEALYSYVDNATSSGAVDSASNVKGLVEVATGAEAAATAAIGSGNTTAPLVLTTGIATSTRNSATAANVIPVTNSSGYIDNAFLSPTGSTTMATTSINGTLTVQATTTIQGINPVASSIIYAQATSSVAFNGTSPQTLLGITLPGGTLKTDGGIHIHGNISDLDNSSNFVTMQICYGGTGPCSGGAQLAQWAIGTNATNDTGYFDVYIYASSSASLQRSYFSALTSAGENDFGSGYTGAVNSASDQQLIVLAQWNGIGDNIQLNEFIVRSIR